MAASASNPSLSNTSSLLNPSNTRTPDITTDASIISHATSTPEINLSNTVTASSSSVNDLKDILVAQFEIHKLNRESHKLNREADAVRQTELTKTMMEISFSNKLPALLKLETKKDWPQFWMIMQHYLTKGKINKLEHVDSGNEFNNVKASMALDDALVTIINGDALKMFLHRKDEYHGKGFKKLALLKDKFAGDSQIQTAKEMFAFF